MFFVLFNCYWKLNFPYGSRHISTGEPCSKISHLSETSPETTKETETPETPLACPPPTVPKHHPDTPKGPSHLPQGWPVPVTSLQAQAKGSSIFTSPPGEDTHLLDTLLTPHLPPRPAPGPPSSPISSAVSFAAPACSTSRCQKVSEHTCGRFFPPWLSYPSPKPGEHTDPLV